MVMEEYGLMGQAFLRWKIEVLLVLSATAMILAWKRQRCRSGI
jgi:hypothetical protein